MLHCSAVSFLLFQDVELCAGLAGPAGICQQTCFVKVTRVKSNLLARSSKSVPAEAPPPDPQDTSVEALETNQPLKPEPDDKAPCSGTEDTLDSKKTSANSCVAKSSSSRSPEHQSTCPGASREENPIASNPSSTIVTTETGMSTEHSGAPSSDMPFLTPEVTEYPEGRQSPNLSSEMPFLTLAVQSSENSHTLPNPNEAEKSTKPQNAMGETSVCLKAPYPDWCSNPFQGNVRQSLGYTNKELHEKKDGDGSASMGQAVIPGSGLSPHLKASTDLFRCSSVQDSPSSSNTNALPNESPSTSYDQNAPNKLLSPLDETDFTSSALPNLFEESTTIWKNFNYQTPEVSDLAVPYAMWEEPRCQQVKCPDPSEFPEKSVTFTDLEPSVVHHSNAELFGSPGKSQRTDSSSESDEENSSSEAEYGESGMEPGEIRIVST